IGWKAQKLSHGRKQINGTRLRIDDCSGRHTRPRDQQWYMQGVIVDEDPMGLFSMVIQPLSMVTHHNDQRAFLKFRFLEKVEQASHLLVGVSNFTRVRILGVAALK